MRYLPMYHISIGVIILFFATLCIAVPSSNNTYIYTQSSLGDISASNDCISALTANVSCNGGLQSAVLQTSTWSTNGLKQMCADDCKSSLADYISTVDEECGTEKQYNISGIMQTASEAGRKMQWQYNATCLVDSSSGEYCNTLFQGGGNTSVSDIKCSSCYLNYLSTVINSKWGQSLFNPSVLTNQVRLCGATGYSVTYTAPATSISASASSTATAEVQRCNLNDSSTVTYTVEKADSCNSISVDKNVSTNALVNMNGLGSGCAYLVTGQRICLPDSCQVARVGSNDTTSSIVSKMSRKVTTKQFLSWNPSLSTVTSNLSYAAGTYVCVTPPGTMELDGSFPLKTAKTAAPVPTDAVTTSNTNCGLWHKVSGTDGCDTMGSDFDISMTDLRFLNPQLDSDCRHLWVNNSYCVQPVGNIKTYSGYSSFVANTTTKLTSFSNTINLNQTRAVNRTTSYTFFSWPTNTVSTAQNINSTEQARLANYTLCDQVYSRYNISDDLTDEMYDNDAWMSEYDRVCELNPNIPLPTRPFNYSIPLDTTTQSYVPSSTVSPGSKPSTRHATSTAASASATSTGKTVSPDGTCGTQGGYTCASSTFGSCCSKYGDCGSSDDYCGSNCDPGYGSCSQASSTFTSSATATSASSTPSGNISSDGTCGTQGGYTCLGSSFGDCCSKFGDCGSSDDYCGTNCDPNYGSCSNSGSNSKTISQNGLCGVQGGATCLGSTFGQCCSINGDCGSTDEYCGSNCDPKYGSCTSSTTTAA
ncbi:hypothetical protein MW887_004489 [Aspergillus wentii]|nr:hypothetical protein MW887_004489 [Aspergillus wentii]